MITFKTNEVLFPFHDALTQEKQDADRSGQDARMPHFPNQKRTRRV